MAESDTYKTIKQRSEGKVTTVCQQEKRRIVVQRNFLNGKTKLQAKSVKKSLIAKIISAITISLLNA